VSRSHLTDGMSQMLRGGQLLNECTFSKEESLPVVKDCEWIRDAIMHDVYTERHLAQGHALRPAAPGAAEEA